MDMPNYSDVLLHSHPILEDEAKNPGYIPSIGDLRNCSQTATNLIASGEGITQYGPISDQSKRQLDMETYRFAERFGKGSLPQYLKFLEEIGVTFEVNAWDKMTPEKFNLLLKI